MQDLAPVLGAAVTNILQRWPQIDPSRVSFQSQDFFVDNLVEKSDDLVFMARRILHVRPCGMWLASSLLILSSRIGLTPRSFRYFLSLETLDTRLMSSFLQILKGIRSAMAPKNKLLILGTFSLRFPPCYRI